MTIFQRPEKPNETDTAVKPVVRETPREPAPVPEPSAAEVKRPQATAQPMAQPQRPQVSYAAQGAHGVSQGSHAAGAPMASVISKALKITGQLESSEDIQIDGQIEGDVRGVYVKVGINARVKGTVYGEEVELAGTVEGKIEAKKVILSSTAHMSGDVVHQDIRIESGAFIDGHCKPDFGKTEQNRPAAVKSLTPTSVIPARTAAE
ncbi:MAG TPA: polymer-forming cytoskeletal protein [Rhizomicrobium sp.]